jgi:hypothetical protein
MTRADTPLERPATQRDRPFSAASIFGLLGGPLAWYVQMCAGYALASWPCFPKDERNVAPLAGFAWTWPAMIVALIAGVVVALAAFSVSYRAYTRTQAAAAADQWHVVESGGGRKSFLALWGTLLGAGFALTTVVTAVGFVVLPRCAG